MAGDVLKGVRGLSAQERHAARSHELRPSHRYGATTPSGFPEASFGLDLAKGRELDMQAI